MGNGGMTDSKIVVKTFRLLVLLSVLLTVVAAGLLVDASLRETRLVEAVRALYKRQGEVIKWCSENSNAPSCGYARELKDRILPGYMESRRENRERSEVYAWLIAAAPVTYLLFLLVRYALTARLRPLWPWRL